MMTRTRQNITLYVYCFCILIFNTVHVVLLCWRSTKQAYKIVNLRNKNYKYSFCLMVEAFGSCICLTADLYVSHVFVYLAVIFFCRQIRVTRISPR